MKMILVLWLSVWYVTVSAQPLFLSHKDVGKNGISQKDLDHKYGILPEHSVPIDIPFSVVHKMNQVYQSALGKNIKPVSVTTHLYLNEQGKIDYLVYTIAESGWIMENGKVTQRKTVYNIDSLNVVLKQKLPPLLEGFASNRNWNRKDHLRLYTAVGESQGMTVAKPPKKKDSVTDLMEAMSVTDTLTVKHLTLERSLLTALPDVVYRFPNLEVLNLGNNDLTSVSFDMSRLPKLKNIDLSANLLTAGGIKFTRNKSLKILNLQKNQLVDIPETLRDCKALESVWLGRNKFSALENRSFKPLRHIKDLNLYKAEISVLPGGVRKMRKLEVLDLYYNNLTTLPASLAKLKRITHLAVAYNQLTVLPKKVGKMKKMTHLYAHHNRLSKLPKGISKMKDLVILDLGFNWFTDFPSEVASLVKLEELELTSNNLQAFPKELLQVKHLDKVFLRGNPFIENKPNVTYSSQLDDLKSKNIEVFH